MRKNKLLRVVLLIVIVCTIVFIWTQSCFSKTASASQSGWVLEFLQNGADLLGLPIQLDQHTVRKMAHFLEFFVLGFELTLYTVIGVRTDRRDIVRLLGTLFLVAFMDETIQIFAKRGPSVADVWLDIAGGITAMLLCFALHYLCSACKNKRRTKRS